MKLGPLKAFVGRINLRHWRQHRLRTALTVLGVTTGVALLVAVMVINSTLLTTVRASAERLGGAADLEVAAPDSTGLPAGVIEEVASVEGVRHAVPVMRTYTEMRGPGGSHRLLILGVTPEFVRLMPEELKGDDSFSVTGSFGAPDDVMLAADAIEELGVEPGEKVSAQVPTGYASLNVSGHFSGRAVESLGTGDVGIMWLPYAQETFERADKVDSVYVIADDSVDRGQLRRKIEAAVQAGAVVGDPGARAEGFEEALNGIAALTSLAGTVALFVAAFVVFNTMSMSIAERRREISLSLAIGASRRQVKIAFVAEALVLGSIACAVGIVAGFFMARVMVQPALDGLRVFSITAVAGASLEVAHVVIAVCAGLGVAVLGSYVPARKILKIAPVESLRPQGSYATTGTSASQASRVVLSALGIACIVAGVAVGAASHDRIESAAWLSNAALLLLLAGATLLLPPAVALGVSILRRLLPGSAGISARLAVDAVSRNPGRTTLTVGALVFTLGIVVAVGGALDSYESQWQRSADAWYPGPIQVVSTSFVSLGSDQPLPVSLRSSLEGTEGVRGAYPTRYRVVNIDGRQTTIYIPPEMDDSELPGLTEAAAELRTEIGSALHRNETVVSALAARKKGLDVGDTLTVPTPSGEVDLTVGGITHDLNPLDSMFVDADTFLQHWGDPRVDRFELTIDEGFTSSEVVANVRETMRAQDVPARVMTKEQLTAETFEPIAQIFSMARGIQLAALLVAALAIANTMFITVLERRWELGLQRAIGMAGFSMRRTLLTEAGVIGLIGGIGAWIVGLGTGYLMVQDMERAYMFSFPFEIPVGLMALTFALGGLIAIAAGIHPSRTAIRTPIVEALRFE